MSLYLSDEAVASPMAHNLRFGEDNLPEGTFAYVAYRLPFRFTIFGGVLEHGPRLTRFANYSYKIYSAIRMRSLPTYLDQELWAITGDEYWFLKSQEEWYWYYYRECREQFRERRRQLHILYGDPTYVDLLQDTDDMLHKAHDEAHRQILLRQVLPPLAGDIVYAREDDSVLVLVPQATIDGWIADGVRYHVCDREFYQELRRPVPPDTPVYDTPDWIPPPSRP